MLLIDIGDVCQLWLYYIFITKVDLYVIFMNLYIGIFLAYRRVLFYDQFRVYVEPSEIGL